jgi:Zn-dependent metalloprotease
VGVGNQLPSRYKGTHWYYGLGDNGGVHYNLGVQNFFFYLLCEGGSGNNDGIGYTVDGIGITNAEKVAYRHGPPAESAWRSTQWPRQHSRRPAEYWKPQRS